jgi:hypothetical protein
MHHMLGCWTLSPVASIATYPSLMIWFCGELLQARSDGILGQVGNRIRRWVCRLLNALRMRPPPAVAAARRAPSLQPIACAFIFHALAPGLDWSVHPIYIPASHPSTLPPFHPSKIPPCRKPSFCKPICWKPLILFTSRFPLWLYPRQPTLVPRQTAVYQRTDMTSLAGGRVDEPGGHVLPQQPAPGTLPHPRVPAGHLQLVAFRAPRRRARSHVAGVPAPVALREDAALRAAGW